MLARSGLRCRAAVAVTGLTTLALLGVPPPPADAVGRANLRVQGVSIDETTVVEGEDLGVTHVVLNKGKRGAGASTTRFYLTSDVGASLAERRMSNTQPASAVGDLLLAGAAAVRAVKAGKKQSVATTTVAVPVGTPPGDYRLLACADDQAQVKESQEGDNCAAASQELTVQEAPGSQDLVVQQYADTRPWPDDESDGLKWLKAWCDAAYPVQPLTLDGALASVEQFLVRKAGAGALEELADSGEADTAEAAQELAATAVLNGSPGLALAALLRAHRLEPRNGTHLVNAAGMATAVGLPNEALAFLDAAVGRDFLRPVAGIPHQATAMVIRGQALLMTGRLAQAKPMFAQAKRLAPLLSEADAGLAAVAACEDQDQVAMRYARRSRVRSDDPVPPTPPTEMPQQPEPQLDVTRGQAMPLRHLPIAQTPAQGVKMDPVYREINDAVGAKVVAQVEERSELEQHLRDTDDARTLAEIERRDDIFVLLSSVFDEGEVADAYDAFWAKTDELVEHREAFFGGGTGEAPYTYGTLADDAHETCEGSTEANCWIREMNATCRPALTTAHAEFRDLMGELQQRGDRLMELASKRMSGLAANLEDAEAHRLALLEIEMTENNYYGALVQHAQLWTHNEDLVVEECVEPLDADVLEPPTDEAAESPGACTASGLKAISFKFELGPTKYKVSCEKLTQSISSKVIPLIDLYAEVAYDFRTGETSIFAGVKAKGTLGVVEGNFKSGVYLTTDSLGEITDVGWRVGPSVNVTRGGLEVSAFKDEIDISFVPEVEATP